MQSVRNAGTSLKDRAITGAHDYDQISALIESGRRRVADFHTDLEGRLEEVPFVAGERFSAPDITAIITIDFSTKALGLSIPQEYALSLNFGMRWSPLVRAWPPRLELRRCEFLGWPL